MRGQNGHDRQGRLRLDWRRLPENEVMAARKVSTAAASAPRRCRSRSTTSRRRARRLAGAIVDTDCDWSRTLSGILGCKLWLKFENQQFTASFKERGALNRLLLPCRPRSSKRGVIAMSAGNHAQGVAYHAQPARRSPPPSSCPSTRRR